MIVKNNYNQCLTNLACSIRKYFDLDYNHNTLEYVDKILNDRKPKNVVTILFDGMGSNVMDRNLDKEAFLVKNKIKNITTVFPATTVAATTSILTGLNPCESVMLGWNMYFKGIDKTVATFLNIEKGDKTETILNEAKKYKDENMKTKTIMDDINESGKYQGFGLFPFGQDSYNGLNDMLEKIEAICLKDGKKYIYAYDDEPDRSMHELGADCKEVKDIIKYRNDMVERLSKKLTDTIIFVIADHGHISVENIFLEEYPEIVECLERNTSLEPRTVNFFIKKDKKDKFVEEFNNLFSGDFDLYSKNEIIDSKLFGDGTENKIFRDALGDFLAIAKKNKAILYSGDEVLKSHHSGYTEDEILIPIICIDCTI